MACVGLIAQQNPHTRRHGSLRKRGREVHFSVEVLIFKKQDKINENLNKHGYYFLSTH